MSVPEVKVSSVEIEIGKRKLSLTIDEAKKMHAALNELFGQNCSCREPSLSSYWYYSTSIPK